MALSVAALMQRLKQLGWTADRNVRMDIRWGASDDEIIFIGGGQVIVREQPESLTKRS
jgi:hypothetical protein